MYKSMSAATLLSIGLMNSAQANLVPHEFRAPIKVAAVVTKKIATPRIAAAARNTAPEKSYVYLMNIPLSKDQRHRLQTFKPTPNPLITVQTPQPATNLPNQVQLGMNNVPVLNQGMHGTCVTFATVAALDAILYKSDYISPLCSLEVGSYLESRSYFPSGWEGSYGPLILERFSEFGVVSLDKQRAQSCAGITDYPTLDMDSNGAPFSIDDYATMSEDINSDVSWYSLLTDYERFNSNAPADTDKVLNNVKRVLASDNAANSLRLTFGSLLPVEHCSAGACGTHNKPFDTWVITNAIRNDNEPEYGGHEMIITGYDDNAIATDNEGATHTGLLTLRNSWSDQHGDNGDYYMSYDFFKQYVMEVQVITK